MGLKQVSAMIARLPKTGINLLELTVSFFRCSYQLERKDESKKNEKTEFCYFAARFFHRRQQCKQSAGTGHRNPY